MTYSAGTPIVGTREEILQSIYNDCAAIATTSGFSQNVKVAIRQFQGFTATDSPGIIIDTGSDDTPEYLLQDLSKNVMRTAVIGFVYSNDLDLATKVEAWMRDVQRAILLNPYRSISGVPKAWTSVIDAKGTMYSGTLGRFLINLQTTFFDSR